MTKLLALEALSLSQLRRSILRHRLLAKPRAPGSFVLFGTLLTETCAILLTQNLLGRIQGAISAKKGA